MMPFGGRGRGDFAGLHFPEKLLQLEWSCEHAGKARWHLRASACPHSAGQLERGALPWPHLRFHICQLHWNLTLGKLNINHVSENRQTFLCGLKLEESVCGFAAS